jgi:hypothetical protein
MSAAGIRQIVLLPRLHLAFRRRFFASWGPRLYHLESNDVFKIAHVAEFILYQLLHPSF